MCFVPNYIWVTSQYCYWYIKKRLVFANKFGEEACRGGIVVYINGGWYISPPPTSTIGWWMHATGRSCIDLGYTTPHHVIISRVPAHPSASHSSQPLNVGGG